MMRSKFAIFMTFAVGLAAVSGSGAIAAKARSKGKAATRSADADPAEKCGKDADCYRKIFSRSAITGGQKASAALAGLPLEYWKATYGTCVPPASMKKEAATWAEREGTVVNCLGLKAAATSGKISEALDAMANQISPDDGAFPALDNGILSTLRETCDLPKEWRQGDKMNDGDKKCINAALEVLETRFNKAVEGLKEAKARLDKAVAAKKGCQSASGLEPAQCVPYDAEGGFKGLIQEGEKQAARLDLSGEVMDIVNPEAAAARRKKNETAKAASPVQGGGTPAAAVADAGGDEKLIEINKCRNELKNASSLGEGEGDTVKAVDCLRPSEVAKLETELSGLMAKIGEEQSGWDAVTRRKIDLAQDVLRRQAATKVRELAEAGLSACEFSSALEQLGKSCSSAKVDGKTVEDFNRPLSFAIKAASSKYLPGGPGECGKGGAGEKPSEKMDEERTARAKKAMAAAQELGRLDNELGSLMADFAKSDEEFIKDWPPFLQCRSMLNLAGNTIHSAQAVCKSYGKKTADGGFQKRESGITVGELLAADEFKDPSSPVAQKGQEVVARIKKLEVERMKRQNEYKRSGSYNRKGFDDMTAALTGPIEAAYKELAELRKTAWTLADRRIYSQGILVDPKTGATIEDKGYPLADLYTRCEKKSKMIAKLLEKKAALRAEHPELFKMVNANGGATAASIGKETVDTFDPMGAPTGKETRDVLENLKPLYQQLGSAPNLARRVYQEGLRTHLGGDVAKAAAKDIAGICSDPMGAVNELMGHGDQLFTKVYSCSVDVAEVEPAFREVEKERAAACRARRSAGASDPCGELQAIKADMAGKKTASQKFRELAPDIFQGLDAAACIGSVVGLGAGLSIVTKTGTKAASAVLLAEKMGETAGRSALLVGTRESAKAFAKGLSATVKTGAKGIVNPVGATLAATFTGYGIAEHKAAVKAAEGAGRAADLGVITYEQVEALQKAAEQSEMDIIKDAILGMMLGGVTEFGAGFKAAKLAGKGQVKSPNVVRFERAADLREAHRKAFGSDPSVTERQKAAAREEFGAGMRELMAERMPNADEAALQNLAQATPESLKEVWDAGGFEVVRPTTARPKTGKLENPGAPDVVRLDKFQDIDDAYRLAFTDKSVTPQNRRKARQEFEKKVREQVERKLGAEATPEMKRQLAALTADDLKLVWDAGGFHVPKGAAQRIATAVANQTKRQQLVQDMAQAVVDLSSGKIKELPSSLTNQDPAELMAAMTEIVNNRNLSRPLRDSVASFRDGYIRRIRDQLKQQGVEPPRDIPNLMAAFKNELPAIASRAEASPFAIGSNPSARKALRSTAKKAGVEVVEADSGGNSKLAVENLIFGRARVLDERTGAVADQGKVYVDPKYATQQDVSAAMAEAADWKRTHDRGFTQRHKKTPLVGEAVLKLDAAEDALRTGDLAKLAAAAADADKAVESARGIQNRSPSSKKSGADADFDALEARARRLKERVAEAKRFAAEKPGFIEGQKAKFVKTYDKLVKMSPEETLEAAQILKFFEEEGIIQGYKGKDLENYVDGQVTTKVKCDS